MPDNTFNQKVEQRLHELTGASTTEIRDMALGLQVQNSIDRIVATAPSSAERITPNPPSIQSESQTLSSAPLVTPQPPQPAFQQLVPVIVSGCLNGAPAVGTGAYFAHPAEITT